MAWCPLLLRGERHFEKNVIFHFDEARQIGRLDAEIRHADCALGEARRRVALGLLLAEIAKENALKADAERVRQRIETIASTYDESDKVIAWYYGNQMRLQEIESAVLEDQIVEWILARAKVSEQFETFDALLNPGQTSAQMPTSNHR